MECVIELINSFNNEFKKNNVIVETNFKENKIYFNINFDSQNYNVIFHHDKNQIIFTSNNDDYETIHLINLINKKKYESYDQIVDFLVDINQIIPNLKKYCISCQTSLEVPSNEYSNCGNDMCIYKMEEMPIGDYVLETYKKNPDKVNFLLMTSFQAIKSPRRQDIFEPFPNHFLIEKKLSKPERGVITTISGNKNAHDNKNWTLLDKTIGNHTHTDISKIINLSTNENELKKKLGNDLYILIRFLILSNKCNINQVDLINCSNLKSLQVVHEFDKEEEFRKKSGGITVFLYHGSRIENWYSIMRNGIKVCSNTKMMTAGAAHGVGIYTSDNFNTSLTYCGYNHSTEMIMGVFEVIGNKSDYKPGNSIFVIPNEDKLILRYILCFPYSLSNTIGSRLNEKFNIKIQQETIALTNRIKDKGLKRLLKDLSDIQKSTEFNIMVDQNNLQKWNVTLFDFDKDSDLVKDLMKYDIPFVEIEILFDDNYPYHPPFVRIVRPRFVYQTGHITSKGALCMQLLTPQKWSPAYSVESLLVQIKSTITEGGAKIDPANYNTPYTLQEAKTSFIAVAKQHGWM